MDILIYCGEGTGQAPVAQAKAAISKLLLHRHDIKLVNHNALINEPWMESTALLIIPGGRDLPYTKLLNGKGNEKIKKYVENGGSFLGLCAGGYYGSQRIEFELNTKLEVKGDRELAFFPGCAAGGVFPGFVYESELGSRAASIALDKSCLVDVSKETIKVYYNGGCSFHLNDGADGSNIRPLAFYDDEGAKGKMAIIECKVGKGTAILSGVHFEYDPHLLDSNDPTSSKIIPELNQYNSERFQLIRSVLRRLGLKTAEQEIETPRLTNLGLVCLEEQLFDNLWSNITAALDVELSITSFETKDKLKFSRNPVPAQIKPEEEKTPEGGNVVTAGYLKSLKDMSIESFDSNIYFDALREYHSQKNKIPTFGSILMYTDVITSTQTLLDKNLKLLQNLPNGFVCSANRQISGRGRGGNSWVSPEGCLQFSFVTRHAGEKGWSVVFVQYLIALAVVQAVTSLPGYQDIGIHLKWPNDIYSKSKDAPHLKKIGGILVNSNWMHNQFLLVVGCGINLNNSEPTDCINDVITRYNIEKTKQLDLLRKEQLLARILGTFEDFNQTFQEEGFAPFLPLYYKHWLHSGQIVTLSEHNNREVVIEGITDQGLLSTKCQKTSEIFELQPDGNSFDLMKSMISKKIMGGGV